MTTTIMRDSIVGDAWIRQMMQYNPVQRVIDQATGQPNGNIIALARLAFCDSLFEAKPQMKSDPNSKLKHSATLLFPPGYDLSIFVEEFYAMGHKEFAAHYDRAQNKFIGVGEPFIDQAEKALKYGGFTSGAMSMNCSSNYKPMIVDAQGTVITDPNAVYAGVWAIVAVNCYASGKGQPKKGPRFGLQQLMIVSGDSKFGGGAPDPSKTFANARVSAPAAVPGAAFGQAQNNTAAPPPPPPPPGMGGHTGAYYGATGHAPPPPPPPAYGAAPPPPPPAYESEEDAELRRMMGS